MNVCHSLVTTARLLADHQASIFEDRSFTYAELDAGSNQAAHVLTQSGVRRGDRVGLVVPNVPAFAVWYYATLRIGAIAVSVNTRLTGEEVAFILDDCDAQVVVATNELLGGLSDDLPDCVRHVLDVSYDGSRCGGRQLDEQSTDDEMLVELEPDEPATILYTSGTTGFPKGATLSHGNVRATVHAFNHLCQMQPSDRLLLAVPLFHCYGQNALLNSGFNVGATIVLQRGFDLNQSKRLIAEQQVTKLFGVPTTFQLLLDSCTPDELSSVGYCFSAAAALPLQISHRWLEKFGMPIYEGYGLTETAPFASYNHRLRDVPGSLGTPVDLVEMKVVDTESGQERPPGTPGEIAIRGPNVMLGYWNRPEETATAVRDGWFYSGDIGQTDENGYFYIIDRLKDMIAVGAQKVFPAEVERVLLDHAAVAEAAVVGFPDQLMGERVVAFLVLVPESDTSADDIRQYCRQHLGSFKVPSAFEFVAELPRNPAGKVLKKELRNFALSEPAVTPDTAPTSTATADLPPLVRMLESTYAANRVAALVAHLQQEVRQLGNLDAEPAEDASLLSLGMESLMMVELRDRLQAQVGDRHELSATIVFDYPTIAELAAYLVSQLVPDELPSADSNKNSVAAAAADRLKRAALDTKNRVDEMSEESALQALLREMDE